MGYIVVGNDLESKMIEIRDIMVVWRGTMLPSKWYEEMQRDLEPLGYKEAKVERGFSRIYKSKSISTRYNKTSALEQVIEEIKRLTKFYKSTGEKVSVTVTGHSLDDILALLNTYAAAMRFPTLLINFISFGAPRVGNMAFRDELHHRGVKALNYNRIRSSPSNAGYCHYLHV
ncbi:phospholipase A1-Igamma1, chloroplastic [Lactuca sativa]|uniref:phospholipase A1-Igamma1, chloroplastic n=1 Tax=Lactuca sativa TaxID=4236 RepID=UPI000CC4DBF9|nr:phospholipase A1-Igamma1, chloroplastic [Lactuca sativa]